MLDILTTLIDLMEAKGCYAAVGLLGMAIIWLVRSYRADVMTLASRKK